RPVRFGRRVRRAVRDRGAHLARHAVLRHHAAGRAADDQPRPARGGLPRRRQRLAALLARHVAAPEAGHARGGGVLDHPDVLGLPAHLRADGRRPRERHPPARDLRLPGGCGHRPPGRGRGHLALHAARAVRRRLGAAAIPPTAGGRVVVIEKPWRRWVYFYILLTVFLTGTLLPSYCMLITAIRPDPALYRSSRPVTTTPSWTLPPTLLHSRACP